MSIKQEESEQRRIKDFNMSNADIFKIIHDEELIHNLNEVSSRKGSVFAMKYLEFGFSLGFNNDEEIYFNAYCLNKEGWSNCLNCKPKYMSPVFKFIGFWNTELEDNKKEIETLLRKHKNSLFLCKERGDTKEFKEGTLYWEIFPNAPSLKDDFKIKYSEDLTEIKKVLEVSQNDNTKRL